MLILFDQGTPVLIAKSLTGHSVKTAYELGWDTLKNGELLRAAEEAGFNVLLTTDTNLPYQQDLTRWKIAIVILSRNRWKSIQRVLSEVASAVDNAIPGTYTIVEVPAN